MKPRMTPNTLCLLAILFLFLAAFCCYASITTRDTRSDQTIKELIELVQRVEKQRDETLAGWKRTLDLLEKKGK